MPVADRTRRLLPAVIGLAAVTAVQPAAAATRDQLAVRPVRVEAHTRFRLADPRIDEASGIAVGIRSPGIVYVQNDSGDTNRVFALDARTGETVAVVNVTGARNVDWEDVAVAPDATGTPSLWIADIGDNDFDRSQVQLYRVDEPTVGLHAGNRIATAPAQVWRFTYTGGAANAESLAIAAGGIPYVVTKSVIGRSEVYRLPARPPGPQVQKLAPVAAIDFTPTGTPDPFGVAGELTATGAAVSPDGRLLVVRTYADAWLWPVHDGDLAGAVRAVPTVLALPRQPQGEGVTFDGGGLLVDSEHAGSTVYGLPVPATVAAGAASPVPSAAGPSTESSVAATGTRSAGPPRAAPSRRSTGHGPEWPLIAAFAAVVLAIAGACGLNRLRFRARRKGR